MRALRPAPSSNPAARETPSPGRTTALVAGTLAAGALVAHVVLRRQRRRRLLPAPPPALDAETGAFELMEGRSTYYRRDGEGTPVVLLHSLNAAASSFEMKPLFDHFAATTRRPVYALDWLGFGLSGRPAVRYRPSIYERQLRRFLSEHVREPADVVALSLGCEYAALVAHTLPYLVRRLVLIAPSGLSAEPEGAGLQRGLVSLAGATGLFELFFYRLTQPETLRRFYKEHVFRDARSVPDALVRHAAETTRVAGAHHAPRYFVEGALFTRDAARHAYARLRVPALVAYPAATDGLVQDFARLPEILSRNPEHLRAEALPGGLLPQWEAPGRLFELLDGFLEGVRAEPSAGP